MNTELVAKAKKAKTPEELMALAKENNIEMTEETAKTFFEQLKPKTGELTDDELDNVAGGACYSDDGYLKTTIGYRCKYYEEFYASGVNGTCCKCLYWDQNGANGYEMVGSPLRCLNPNNKRKG